MTGQWSLGFTVAPLNHNQLLDDPSTCGNLAIALIGQGGLPESFNGVETLFLPLAVDHRSLISFASKSCTSVLGLEHPDMLGYATKFALALSHQNRIGEAKEIAKQLEEHAGYCIMPCRNLAISAFISVFICSQRCRHWQEIAGSRGNFAYGRRAPRRKNSSDLIANGARKSCVPAAAARSSWSTPSPLMPIAPMRTPLR